MSRKTRRFRVITGGKCAGKQCIALAVTAMTAQLQRFHDTIEQACTAIQGHVADLATDWDTRPAEFWQEVLTALQALREVVQPAIAYSLCEDLFPRSFLVHRSGTVVAFRHKSHHFLW